MSYNEDSEVVISTPSSLGNLIDKTTLLGYGPRRPRNIPPRLIRRSLSQEYHAVLGVEIAMGSGPGSPLRGVGKRTLSTGVSGISRE